MVSYNNDDRHDNNGNIIMVILVIVLLIIVTGLNNELIRAKISKIHTEGKTIDWERQGSRGSWSPRKAGKLILYLETFHGF